MARNPAQRAARSLLVMTCLWLGACASRPGHFYQDDGPPDHVPAGLAATPDPAPRIEPLNPHANRPYAALGRSYTPDTSDAPFEQRGMASWYGRQYHGNPTASGEPYDMYAMSAAHPTLPIPSYARVTKVSDGRSVIVRINDRGPFLQDRVIDLSFAAATRLGIVGPGSGEVTVQKITAHDIAAGTFGASPKSAVASAPAEAVPVVAPAPPPSETVVITGVVAAAPGPIEVPLAPSLATPAVANPTAPAPPFATAPVPPAQPLAPESAKPPGAPSPAVMAPYSAAPPAMVQAPPKLPDAIPAAAGEAALPVPAPAAATVSDPSEKPASADTAEGDTPVGKWAVQLGAFTVLANAEALRDQMTALLANPAAAGLPESSRHPRIEFDGRLHRVLVGVFDARGAAQRGAHELQQHLARATAIYQR